MNKLKAFREAVKNPRPDRLAKIEYQSHFFQMLGISLVCVILILRGLWWVIFAFVFGLGISYSQGMSAYIKYNNIVALMGDENPSTFKDDISPTRKRGKIITYIFGKWANWVAGVISVGISYLIIGTTFNRWMLMLAYPISITVTFVLVYFFLFYWVANYFYEKKMAREIAK